MARLVIFLLTKRWGWLGAGVLLLIIGGVVFATGHTIKPVEVDGTFAHYTEVTENGSYDHTEVVLNEDSRTFTLHKNDFQPALPSDGVYKNGKANLWVDSGSTDIVAITLYDQNDQNPTNYTTDLYIHPEHGVSNAHNTGIGFGIFSLPFLVVGLAWPIFPWGKKKKPAPAPVVAGYNSAVAGQMGYPQQPGFPQQPQYPAQQEAFPLAGYPHAGYPQQPQQPQVPAPGAPYGQQPQQGQGGWPQQ